jgi:hypothetical protein
VNNTFRDSENTQRGRNDCDAFDFLLISTESRLLRTTCHVRVLLYYAAIRVSRSLGVLIHRPAGPLGAVTIGESNFFLPQSGKSLFEASSCIKFNMNVILQDEIGMKPLSHDHVTGQHFALPLPYGAVEPFCSSGHHKHRSLSLN